MDECQVHGVVRRVRTHLEWNVKRNQPKEGKKRWLAFSEKRATFRASFLKYLPLLVDALSRCGIEDQFVISRRVIEIEHAV
jgi:hypothetical protein